MVSALEIASRIKAKKKPPKGDEEEGSPEEERDEPEAEASAEGDVPGGEPDAEAEGDGDGEMGDYDSIEASAVSDLMSTKDPETFKTALRQFVKACIDRDEE